MPVKKERSFVALTAHGNPIGMLETDPEEQLPSPLQPPEMPPPLQPPELPPPLQPPEFPTALPPPEPLTQRQHTAGTHRSFVELTVHGAPIGCVESPPPVESDGSQTPRRSPWWSLLACESRKETSEELTAKIKQQEEASLSSSNSSAWDRNVPRVPYANAYANANATANATAIVGGPEPYSLPPPILVPQQQQQRSPPPHGENSPHSWNSPPGKHARSPSSSSSIHSSMQSPDPMSIIINNLNTKHLEQESAAASPDTSKGPSKPSSRLKEFTTELKSLLADIIEYSKAKTWKKKLLTVVLFVISTLVFYDLFFGRQDYIVTWLHSFVVWMTTHHALAVFAFVGIFVVSTLAFVPPTLLVFGAGYAFTVSMDNVLYGVTAATISCFLGSWIGAIIAFVRSRYMMRDLVKLFANRYPLVRAIDQALKHKHGFRIMLLLRFCPIIPFNGLNYCCGITGIRLYDFALSLIGILPFQVFTVALGATAGAVELQDLKHDDYNRGEKAALIAFIVTGVLFGLVAVLYVWHLVKKELQHELGVSREEFETLIRPVGTMEHESSELRGSTSMSSLPYHLEDDNSNGSNNNISNSNSNSNSNNELGSHRSDTRSIRSTPTGRIPYQEEGEEWFWVWV